VLIEEVEKPAVLGDLAYRQQTGVAALALVGLAGLGHDRAVERRPKQL
jgi:hypothetical protein